jgi:hypothetical protein
VVETLLRIESAEIAHRVWGSSGPNSAGGEGWLIIEIHNRSPKPVAVCVFANGWTMDGPSGSAFAAKPDGIRSDHALILLGQRPASLTCSAEDLASALAQEAPEPSARFSGATRHLGLEDAAAANAGLVWPLITDATIRLAVPNPAPTTGKRSPLRKLFGSRARSSEAAVVETAAAGGAGEQHFPGGLAPTEAVISGWERHIQRGGNAEVPDPAIAELLRRALAAAMLIVDNPGEVGAGDLAMARAALALWGHSARPEELRRLDEALGEAPAPRAALAVAVAATCEFVLGDDAAIDRFDEQLSPILAACLLAMDRAVRRDLEPADAVLVEMAARWCEGLFGRIGHPDAARRAGQIAARCGSAGTTGSDMSASAGTVSSEVDGQGSAASGADRPTLARAALASDAPFIELKRLASEVQAVGSLGPGVATAAIVLIAAHRALVGMGTEADAVRLATSSMAPWVGQNWEVSRLRHPLASVSYAIRWHGPRPALLWELSPLPGAQVAHVRCGLDPAFDSQALVGETLLGSPAGLAGVAPAEGESFD